MTFYKLIAVAFLVLAGSIVGLMAGDADAHYRRVLRPHFSSKTIHGEHTRLEFLNLDIRNNTFTAQILRQREVLYEVEFTFATPPRDLSGGQTFEIPVSMKLDPSNPAGFNEDWVMVRYDLEPGDHFSATGFPLQEHPKRLTMGELRAAGEVTDRDAALSQKLQVSLQAGEAKTLVIGYTLLLAWDNDAYEIEVQYTYKRSRGRSKKKEQPSSTASEDTGDMRVAISVKPWSEQRLVAYFSEYLANLNGAIRSNRGIEWSVDAWGREVGPRTTLTVTPDGSWKSPNHYLWVKNQPYEFYGLTIREYIRARFDGASVNELVETGSR